MFGLFKKQDPITHFWKWFNTEEKNIRDFQSDPDNILNQVLNKVRKIEKGLALELEPPKNNIINLTISANGNKNLFPVVQRIVEKAPKIDGWDFIAFRQPIPKEKLKGITITIKGLELSPDKMKFFPVTSGDGLDIIIYSDNITEENYNQVAYGGLLLVDNILGEYDCVTKIRSYDFQNMPTNQEELRDLLPMTDLPEFVDNFHKSRSSH